METNPQIRREPDSHGRAAPTEHVSKHRKSLRALGTVAVVVALFAAVAFGAFLGSHFGGAPPSATGHDVEEWYCSMHPTERSDKPGQCRVCFMDLVPLKKSAKTDGEPRTVTMSPAAMALAEIETAPVERRYVSHTVRMIGKIDYDETRVSHITAWIPGRLDRLYVDFTGVNVRQGDHMVYMYSPDLVLAQRSLLQAWQAYQRTVPNARTGFIVENLKSAEDKLRLWGLFDEQIEEIKERGTPSDHMTINAPSGGVVVEKSVNQGEYVETGTQIYTIADLSHVWVFLSAYESDIPWIHYGQEVEFTAEAYPGETFTGRIAFVDPVLDEKTRTVKVRVNVINKDMRLKPGMFVSADVKSRVLAGGQVVDPILAGKWISPMHPEIIKNEPGKCDLCGMDLVPAAELGFVSGAEAGVVPLVVPDTAPLITGKRALVYVRVPDRQEPTFEGREVALGDRADGWYIVRYGLAEGERVVVNGNFKLDSALQIEAQPSMMSSKGERLASSHHDHASESHEVSDVRAQHDDAIDSIPDELRTALSPIYEEYLAAVALLAVNDATTARAALEDLVDSANHLDASILNVATRRSLVGTVDNVALAAHEASRTRTSAAMREGFADLSMAVSDMVRQFGHALDAPLHEFHCPIANGSKGADWLQFGSEVRNPYLGREMLDCGQPRHQFEPIIPLLVSAEFRAELTGVYDAYLRLQAALARDSLDEARSGIHDFNNSLTEVHDGDLNARTQSTWEELRGQMADAIDDGRGGTSLNDIRRRFDRVSTSIVRLATQFRHVQSITLQKTFCPMAFDNRGAVWLQPQGDITNPYFGAKMLRCGRVEQTYAPAVALQEAQR